jgi:hypothetical protein
MTFRMTQVLTGHGAFKEYLLRVRWEVTDTCQGEAGHGATHAGILGHRPLYAEGATGVSSRALPLQVSYARKGVGRERKVETAAPIQSPAPQGFGGQPQKKSPWGRHAEEVLGLLGLA